VQKKHEKGAKNMKKYN